MHRPGGRKRMAVNATWFALVLCPCPVLGDDPPPDGPQEETLTLDSASAAQDAEAEARPRFWDRVTENLRLNVDVISRGGITRRRGKPSSLQSVGLDIHKVFSDRKGDIGTMVLQPYLRRIDNALPVPHDAEDDDDWEAEFHTFSFNLTRWGKGATNFKVGHFYIPYGLQVNTDTHQTIYQLISHENLGADMDWGASFNGTTRWVEYEVALTQGSGHEYDNVGKNYVVAGRLGSPFDRNFSMGVSGMHGQIIDPHGLARWRSTLKPPSRVDQARGRIPDAGRGDDDLVRRTRAGVDAVWIVRQFTFKCESSIGRDFNQDVFNNLLEIGWTNPSEKFNAYLQGIYLGQRGESGWDEDIETRLGAVWKFAPHWSLSGEYSQDMTTYGTRPEDAMFTIQLRHTF